MVRSVVCVSSRFAISADPSAEPSVVMQRPSVRLPLPAVVPQQPPQQHQPPQPTPPLPPPEEDRAGNVVRRWRPGPWARELRRQEEYEEAEAIRRRDEWRAEQKRRKEAEEEELKALMEEEQRILEEAHLMDEVDAVPEDEPLTAIVEVVKRLRRE